METYIAIVAGIVIGISPLGRSRVLKIIVKAVTGG